MTVPPLLPLDPGIRLVIFDADGTLRWTTVEGQPCPNDESEWRLMPNVRERLRVLDFGPHGLKLGVASNQGGVAVGYLSADMARKLLVDTVDAALGFVPPDAAIELCICHPQRACDRRKPSSGMLRRIMDRFAIPPDATLFVGDLDVDRDAARRARTRFAWSGEFFGGNHAPSRGP